MAPPYCGLPARYPILGPWVVFAMDFFELGFVDMGVYLGGGGAGMAQQFLDDPEVGSTLQHVCGERVADVAL